MSSERRILRAALRKARGEIVISLLLIGIIASTLSSFTILSSASSSLQSGLQTYYNEFAPWIVITPNGPCQFPGCRSTLPQSVISNISAAPHVQSVYPITIFTEREPFYNLTQIFNGVPVNLSGTIGVSGVAVGGPNGFPPSLLEIAKGTFPQDSQAALVADPNLPNFTLGSKHTVFFGGYDSSNPLSNNFTATVSGIAAINPLFNTFYQFWNYTFLKHEMNESTYNSLFYGEPNYVIVKSDSINNVPAVVDELNNIIESYPRFNVEYNQVLIDSLTSFQSQTAPLYYALDAVALIAAIGVTAMLANVIAGRRSWEAGLFITQGWSWSSVFRLYYIYFLSLSMVGFAISLIASLIVSHYLVYRYIVYGTILSINLNISPLFVAISFILAVATPFIASHISLRKFRKRIDRMLAEY